MRTQKTRLCRRPRRAEVTKEVEVNSSVVTQGSAYPMLSARAQQERPLRPCPNRATPCLSLGLPGNVVMHTEGLQPCQAMMSSRLCCQRRSLHQD